MTGREIVSASRATKLAKRWVFEQREAGNLPAGVYARFKGWTSQGQRKFEVGYETARSGDFMRVLNLAIGADYVPIIYKDRRDRREVPAIVRREMDDWCGTHRNALSNNMQPVHQQSDDRECRQTNAWSVTS